MAFLCVLSDDGADRVVDTIVLPPEGGIIGRGETATIRLSAMSVSREHARVQLSADGWRIEALSSTNEVLVRGIPTRSSILKRGNEIQLGTIRLRFETQDPRRQRTVAAGEFKPPAQVSRRLQDHSRPREPTPVPAGTPLEIARAQTDPLTLEEPTESEKAQMRASRNRPGRIGVGTMPVITARVQPRPQSASGPSESTAALSEATNTAKPSLPLLVVALLALAAAAFFALR